MMIDGVEVCGRIFVMAFANFILVLLFIRFIGLEENRDDS